MKHSDLLNARLNFLKYKFKLLELKLMYNPTVFNIFRFTLRAYFIENEIKNIQKLRSFRQNQKADL